MLSKCANPSCSAAFLYFHRGQLYRVEKRNSKSNTDDSVPMTNKKPVRSVEYYWLCESCAARWTLVKGEGGVVALNPVVAREALVLR